MVKKTPKPIIKSLSFKYKNFDCYEHIKDMPNFSDYICDLIRLDMEYDLLKSRPRLCPRPVTEEENPEKVNNVVTKKINTTTQIITTEYIEQLADDEVDNSDEYINF
ncbi:MAG: hypothetical protein J6D47_20485 [Peptostreptococcaceae bacterium]|nr:hypothetical protein [Peptostreptococcaceae bacterium]